MIYFDTVPKTPQDGVDWAALSDLIPWRQDMLGCMQDPVFHAEGDVWTHTQMVVSALLGTSDYWALPETRRRILFWAAVLHDIAKPKTRDVYYDDHLKRERVSHPRHSRLGEQMARPFLWELGSPLLEREEICSLIRYHQRIFHLLNSKDPLKGAIEMSLRCKLYDLYLHAIADNRGRRCLTTEDTELQLDCTNEFFQEHEILEKSWDFTNGLSCYEYFSKSDRSPYYEAFDHNDTCEVVMLSGLPGSGKDHLIQQFYPDHKVVSLDDIREEIGAAPTGNQGAVVHAAFDLSKEFLRAKQNFVWNATSLSKDLRSKPLKLFKDYKARTTIHYLEVTHDCLYKQNKSRERVVPEMAIKTMLSKWQPPDPWEADEVIWQFEDQKFALPV